MENTPETVTPEEPLQEMHDRLLKEAEALDAAPVEDSDASSAEQDVKAGATEEADRAAESGTDKTEKTDNPEPSADDKERPRDATGKFVKKDAPPPQGEAQAPPEDKAAVKAAKDAERLDRSWQNLEREKAAVRETQARLERLEHEVRSLATRPQESARFDSQQYARASYEFSERAKKLLSDGDIEGGMEQLKLAEQTRQAADEAAKQEAQTSEQSFLGTWQNNAREVIRDVPELGDPNSELAKEMQKLLTEHPVLGFVPDGFRQGYEILQLRKTAAEASGLREENQQLKQEIERLTKAATPAAPKASAKHTAPTGNETLQQMEERLRREAEELDRAA